MTAHTLTEKEGERGRERERGWHCGRVPSKCSEEEEKREEEEGVSMSGEERNRQIPEGRKADGGKG